MKNLRSCDCRSAVGNRQHHSNQHSNQYSTFGIIYVSFLEAATAIAATVGTELHRMSNRQYAINAKKLFRVNMAETWFVIQYKNLVYFFGLFWSLLPNKIVHFMHKRMHWKDLWMTKVLEYLHFAKIVFMWNCAFDFFFRFRMKRNPRISLARKIMLGERY